MKEINLAKRSSVFRRSRKGQVEVQFNWIYMVVVGGAILLLFVGIIGGIRKGAKESLEKNALMSFDDIFTSMQGSEKTEHYVNLAGLGIEFDVMRENCEFYNILGSDRAQQSTAFVPLFSPRIIEDQIKSYSLGWDIPFRATYFLYLTSSNFVYVIVKGPDAIRLKEDLPELKVESDDPSNVFIKDNILSVKDENYDGIKFILINQEPDEVVHQTVKKKADSEVSAINILPSGNLYSGGTVKFYKKDNDVFVLDRTVKYVDRTTLFAAIFSHSADSYECNLDKGLERVNKNAYILSNRIQQIMSTDDLTTNCEKMMDKYSTAATQINRLKTRLYPENVDELIPIMEQLNSINSELNRKSCPTIY